MLAKSKDTLLMLIRELARHFPARVPEWAMAGAMFGWGAYTLLNPGIFQQPYLHELAKMAWMADAERFWGLVTVVVGMVRGCALFVNGSYSRTPTIRLISSLVSAFVWAQIIVGIMRTGLPAHGIILYSTALALDFVSAYRAAVDSQLARAAKGEPKSDVRSLPSVR